VVRETQQDLVLHQSNSEDSQEETTDDNSTVDEAIADNDADAAVEDRFQIGRRSLGTIDLPDELKRSIARIIQSMLLNTIIFAPLSLNPLALHMYGISRFP
jgi:hypothetical protein